MKKSFLTILGILFLAISVSFGQSNYSDIYALAGEDVQIKMNSNKILGVDVLEGVKTTHVLAITGMDASKKAEILAAFEGSPIIVSVLFNEDLSQMTVKTIASLYRADLESVLAAYNLVITNYSTTYSIND